MEYQKIIDKFIKDWKTTNQSIEEWSRNDNVRDEKVWKMIYHMSSIAFDKSKTIYELFPYWVAHYWFGIKGEEFIDDLLDEDIGLVQFVDELCVAGLRPFFVKKIVNNSFSEFIHWVNGCPINAVSNIIDNSNTSVIFEKINNSFFEKVKGQIDKGLNRVEMRFWCRNVLWLVLYSHSRVMAGIKL